MSVQSRLKEAEIRSKEGIAEADREQREKESLRSFIPKFPTAGLKVSVNDPSWYTKYQPSETVVNLPQYVTKTIPVSGSILERATHTGSGSTAVFNTARATLPLLSVISHKYLPHIGRCGIIPTNRVDTSEEVIPDNPEDYPINNAILRDLMQLGKFNSRTVVPDPSIMGFYVLATVDLYAVLTKIRLALGIALHFESVDTTLPRNLLRGLGFNPDTFMLEIKTWRTVYQELSTLVNVSLPIPGDLTLLARRLWLSSTIIRSSESSLSPIHVFNQVTYGRVNDDATKITYADWVGLKSVSTFRSWFKQAVNALLLNEEICTFIANLRAGISEEKFYKMSMELPTSVEIPMLDEVRLIIQNMEVLPIDAAAAQSFMEVYHDVDGNIKQTRTFALNEVQDSEFGYAATEATLACRSHHFNAFRVWDPEYYLTASRFKYDVVYSGGDYDAEHQVPAGDYGNITFINCGTEILCGSACYVSKEFANIVGVAHSFDICSIRAMTFRIYDQTNVQKILEQLGLPDLVAANFNFVSKIIDAWLATIDGIYDIFTFQEFGENSDYLYFHREEVDHWTLLTSSELQYLNEVAVKSLYFLSDEEFKNSYMK